jgi:hypothetical protein
MVSQPEEIIASYFNLEKAVKKEPWLDSILFRLNSAVALGILFLLLGSCVAVFLISSIAVMSKGSPLLSFATVAAAVAALPVIRSFYSMTGQDPTMGTLFTVWSLGLMGLLFGFVAGPGLARIVLAGSGSVALIGAVYFFVRRKRDQRRERSL